MVIRLDSLINKFKIATEMFNGFISASNRKIHYIQLFATNRCNSRCKICYIWHETPKHDLKIEIIKSLFNSAAIDKNAIWSLVGGEFILHPEHDKILELFNDEKKKYILYSNGVFVDRLISAVKKFKVPELILSLDGTKETYLKVRGIDAYDNVINVIEELKDFTNLNITYTINPLNSREDFKHVKNIAEKYGIGLGVVVYDTREIFHTEIKENKLYNLDGIFKSRYLDSYKLWKENNLKIPCFSIRTNLTVMPNGDIPICQFRNNILGNLYQNSIDEIWSSGKEIQDKLKTCSQCWISCYKGFDNLLSKTISTFVPKFIARKYIGDFNWEKIGRL